eukprot:g3720.t1
MSRGMIRFRKGGDFSLQHKDRNGRNTEKGWSIRSLRRRDFLTATTLSLGMRSNSATCTEEEEQLESLSQLNEVPIQLSLTTLKNSMPSNWYPEFQKLVTYKNKVKLKTKKTMDEIYKDLEKKQLTQTDLVTLGDTWITPAIQKGLIRPFISPIHYRWFQNLPNRWKSYVKRDKDGQLSDLGKTWAVPFRWGLNVIAYKEKALNKVGLDGIFDWSDLLHSKLRNRIAWFNSPRDLTGVTLKSLGLSYNTGLSELKRTRYQGNKTLQEVARERIQGFKDNSLVFSNTDHVRALLSSDAWVCVGSSLDLMPLCRVVSDLKIVFPQSGTSVWTDFFVIPSNDASNRTQESVHNPSPLLNVWLDYVLSPARSRQGTGFGSGVSPLVFKGSTKSGGENNDNIKDVEIDTKGRFLPNTTLLKRAELPAPLNDDRRKCCEELLL